MRISWESHEKLKFSWVLMRILMRISWILMRISWEYKSLTKISWGFPYPHEDLMRISWVLMRIHVSRGNWYHPFVCVKFSWGSHEILMRFFSRGNWYHCPHTFRFSWESHEDLNLYAFHDALRKILMRFSWESHELCIISRESSVRAVQQIDMYTEKKRYQFVIKQIKKVHNYIHINWNSQQIHRRPYGQHKTCKKKDSSCTSK